MQQFSTSGDLLKRYCLNKLRPAIVNLTGGGISGGYKKYLQNIIPRMATNAGVDRLLCASPAELKVHEWFAGLSNVRFVDCKPLKFFCLGLEENLKRNLHKFSPDVIFFPTERYFRIGRIPVVNMVQNMEPFVFKNNKNPGREKIRLWIQFFDGKRNIKRSDRVIVTSRFVKDYLETYLQIPGEKIGLVYHGINASGNQDGVKPAAIPKEWSDNFLFTAGSIRPARGIEDALFAMKHLKSWGLGSVKLVIAGDVSPRMVAYQEKLQNWAVMRNLSLKICWTGKLNEKEMVWCYQKCKLFLMTSRVESFGLIGGEALSHGCRCIVANNPCMPEILGDAVCYYPPKDDKALARKIQTMLEWGDDRAGDVAHRAKKRAEKFSWNICAEKTLAELAIAAGKANVDGY